MRENRISSKRNNNTAIPRMSGTSTLGSIIVFCKYLHFFLRETKNVFQVCISDFVFLSPLSDLPIFHHIGNHAITTIAKRRRRDHGREVQKNSNSLASGIFCINSIMISEQATHKINAKGKSIP